MQFLISFLEGIITFISPCLLPMLPVYISYFAGGGERSMKKTLLTASGFGWGLCSSAGLRRELREREELCRMLALATFQLTRFRTPLPELFALLAAQRSGRASALCAAETNSAPSAVAPS